MLSSFPSHATLISLWDSIWTLAPFAWAVLNYLRTDQGCHFRRHHPCAKHRDEKYFTCASSFNFHKNAMFVLCVAESAPTLGNREWVMFTISCPEQPCSAPVDSCNGFFYGVNSSQFDLHFFLLPLFFPSLLFFSKNPAFSWCAHSRTFLVWSFLPPVMFQGLICSGTHLFILVAVHGILQHYISNKSIFSC